MKKIKLHLGFLIFSSFLFINFSCDGYMSVRGFVVSNFNKSMIVSDSLFLSFNSKYSINDAMINFYALDKNDSITNYFFANTIFSDRNGYFFNEKTIGGKGKAIIVVSKQGYYSDTLDFEYESSEEPINFIINLKQKK